MRVVSLRIAMAAMTAALLWGGDALAQTGSEGTCSAPILDAMKARAWMESQQEIEQNQALVFKPDSVFEYTCFDQIVGITGEHVAPIFSENTYWGQLHDNTHTDRALNAGVLASLRAWLIANFSHTFLGGRTGVNGRPAIDYTPVSDGGGGGYVCDSMRQVWAVAKCWNYTTDPLDQTYLSFDQIGPFGDPRTLPTPCPGAAVWGSGIQSIWRQNPAWRDAYAQNNAQTFALVGPRIRPGQCGQPVPTGVQVKMEGATEFSDAVCTQPGCTYNGSTCQ